MGGFKKSLSTLNTEQRGDLTKGSAFSSLVPSGYGYAITGITGVMAAALPANSTVFAMRYAPSMANKVAYIDRIRIAYNTLAAYTAAVTAGRRLALFRGSAANTTTGGAGLAPVAKDTVFNPTSGFATGAGGDCRIATTGALGVASVLFETDPIVTMTLSHVGTAGAFYEAVYEFSESAEMVLAPGQILAIRNPVVFDAGGTWQMATNIQWREAPAYGA